GSAANAQAPFLQTTSAGRIVDFVSGNGISEVSVTARQTCYFGNGTPINSVVVGEVKTSADGGFSLTYSYSTSQYCGASVTFGKPGYFFSLAWILRGGERVYLGTNLSPLTSVSAASFHYSFAPESIAAAFGVDLASSTEAATTMPLPTSLAGRRILVTDSQG